MWRGVKAVSRIFVKKVIFFGVGGGGGRVTKPTLKNIVYMHFCYVSSDPLTTLPSGYGPAWCIQFLKRGNPLTFSITLSKDLVIYKTVSRLEFNRRKIFQGICLRVKFVVFFLSLYLMGNLIKYYPPPPKLSVFPHHCGLHVFPYPLKAEK